LKFDESTTATFGAGFGLLDLDGNATTTTGCSGKVGQSQQSDWVVNGHNGTLFVNRYYGATTGQRIALRTALNSVVNKTLLIPVFDSGDPTWCGGDGGFHVVGWAAFVIDQQIPNSDWNPHLKIIHGYFVTLIVTDVQSTPGVPGFGVKTISLIQ
jgi:hypothetical protein